MDQFVLAAASELFPVGAPGDAHDGGRMSGECSEWEAAFQIPDFDRVVIAGTGEPFAIGAPGDAIDIVGMPGEDF